MQKTGKRKENERKKRKKEKKEKAKQEAKNDNMPAAATRVSQSRPAGREGSHRALRLLSYDIRNSRVGGTLMLLWEEVARILSPRLDVEVDTTLRGLRYTTHGDLEI